VFRADCFADSPARSCSLDIRGGEKFFLFFFFFFFFFSRGGSISQRVWNCVRALDADAQLRDPDWSAGKLDSDGTRAGLSIEERAETIAMAIELLKLA